jgi:hypothetical protein
MRIRDAQKHRYKSTRKITLVRIRNSKIGLIAGLRFQLIESNLDPPSRTNWVSTSPRSSYEKYFKNITITSPLGLSLAYHMCMHTWVCSGMKCNVELAITGLMKYGTYLSRYRIYLLCQNQFEQCTLYSIIVDQDPHPNTRIRIRIRIQYKSGSTTLLYKCEYNFGIVWNLTHNYHGRVFLSPEKHKRQSVESQKNKN